MPIGVRRDRSNAGPKHATHAFLREKVVEHVFVGEAMRRIWQRDATRSIQGVGDLRSANSIHH
ncbi:hypothetical protein DIE16_22175 [Burkholderia sp. Bp9090]|nr:hypothetical protein DIE16_22175 [Burkholderia sp. Bp9090]